MKYETYKELMKEKKGFALSQKLAEEYGKRYEIEKEKCNVAPNEITAPEHYNATEIEVIKVIETYAVQYPPKIIPHMANVLKYTCRAPYKGNLLKDLKKAQAYLTRAITTLEGEPRWE